MFRKWCAVPAAVLLGCVALVGCGGSGSGGGDIAIGASLPLTGNLASFGPLLRSGYQYAVDEVNANGGIKIDGTARKVTLIIQDNASNPTNAAQQARTMVLKNGAVGLLGSVSPPMNVPVSDVAESLRVPMLMSQTPEEAWMAGNKSGWHYAWDMFWDENQMTNLQFETSNLARTNKKVALFTDNENDGIAQGALWTSKAPRFGYTIAYHAHFPVGTADFSGFIQQAKASGAQIVIAQMIPPDAFALWKQMKSLGYHPKVAFCEKCAAQNAFQQQLGALSNGTSVVDFWSLSRGGGSAQVASAFKGKYSSLDLSTVVADYSAAKVLLDAIARAGSTDPTKINNAIRATNAAYPVGHVTFDSHNRYPVEPTEDQWQGAATKQVFPPVAGVKLQVPVSGLS